MIGKLKALFKREERYAPLDDHVTEITERLAMSKMRQGYRRDEELEVLINPLDVALLTANSKLRLPAIWHGPALGPSNEAPTCMGLKVRESEGIPFGDPIVARRRRT